MKISTKFFTGSAIFVGLIVAILVGNNLVFQQIKQIVIDKSKQSTETIKASLEAENALKSEIIALKDIVLFNTKKSELNQFQAQFLESLDKLEILIPDATKISVIRRRHKFIANMGIQLTQRQASETYLADSQQYFRAINSFNRDIEFFLKDVIDLAYEQSFMMDSQLESLHQMQKNISFAVIGVILILFVGKFLLIWRPVIQSLQKLQMGTAEVASGNFDYRLDICTGDEVEDLAQAFNYMGAKLAQSRETLLENTELTQINQRLELEISERKQAESKLQKALLKLQNTQAQLIQTEKMSSLGQLVAGIAHEINNPVNFIYGNITHTTEYAHELLELIHLYQEEFPIPGDKIQEKVEEIDLKFLLDDLPKVLSSMKIGANRIRELVLSLRTFSRLDEADMKEVDIHEGIESTLLILQNRLKVNPKHPKVEVIKEYGQLPLVECYAGQLNQVFMNILNNAIDAFERDNAQCSGSGIQSHPSQIKICTELVGNDKVLVRIADNGPGMTQEVKQKLFDPFFTTKPVGEGTGLGLSISYQIVVQRHSGNLRCVSELKKGTEFWIEIPLHQQKNQVVSQDDMEAIAR
ncbi:sensor histidine kinase [Cylindrospermum sp. FACHB-282]|uniref:sensor histidine kinase n=1 Tax=Cylindrospermum sp. FACHB-282 TaxID=2692794 RepID=UPI0016871402|nr:ATP-binding protein [Cylindrospermum sp. FACHB-282]MBD2384330.1 HAMP domain-containing protein [Cylindrospermum sp. FACHB-282]